MPRNPNLLPAGVRISDKVTLGQFHRCFPRETVNLCLQEAGRATKRVRELPNDVIVYFVMMLALFREASQTEVLRCIAEGLQWLYGGIDFKITGKSGISQARSRVGWEPLAAVFENCAKPIASVGTKGCFYRGKRIVAMDGTLFNVDDCEENDAFFGRSSNQCSESAFPQARMVSLVECGTHLMFAAVVGKYQDAELTLASGLVSKLTPSMICLADRLFMSFGLFKRAHERGAWLVFRSKAGRYVRYESALSDGSYLANIYASTDRSHREGLRVRVIEYTVNGSQQSEPYRLITNILDPQIAPAEELAALYRERWEFENMLDELKTHLNDNATTLRSKTPDLVIQEIYGLVMAHYAVRSIMYEAAHSAKLDPDELSFVHSIRVLRRKLPTFGSFPPSTVGAPTPS